MSHRKRILVCPLDWGLGHATRCIPIIRLLLLKDAEVIIASEGKPLALLRKEFPDLIYIEFKGYEITYPEWSSMILQMLLSLPKIFKKIKIEHEQLKKIVEEHKIDVVISDNRYGCWTSKAKSVFITHQLMVKAPVSENKLNKLVLKYVKKYDECWIPDVAGENNLSGDLSHKYPVPKNAFFVGALSRFVKDDYLDLQKNMYEYDVMAIISGPEPQRTIFEKMIINQISSSKLKALIVLGLPNQQLNYFENENVKVVSHLSSDEMKTAILNSRIVVTRSGYSTVMDLAILNKKGIFIPTPGQTEQEYLAKLFLKNKINFMQRQSHFNLLEGIKESENYSGFYNFENNNNVLKERIEVMLSST